MEQAEPKAVSAAVRYLKQKNAKFLFNDESCELRIADVVFVKGEQGYTMHYKSFRYAAMRVLAGDTEWGYCSVHRVRKPARKIWVDFDDKALQEIAVLFICRRLSIPREEWADTIDIDNLKDSLDDAFATEFYWAEHEGKHAHRPKLNSRKQSTAAASM